MTLCHADWTFHNPTQKGGVAGAGAVSDAVVLPGVVGLLPVRTLAAAPGSPAVGVPMWYDWLIFVLEKKDEAAAKTESMGEVSKLVFLCNPVSHMHTSTTMAPCFRSRLPD